MSNLRDEYKKRFNNALVPMAEQLERHLRDLFGGLDRIDRVYARPKSIDRFLNKAQKLTSDNTAKYSEPLHQIQDQIGARIITFYTDDVEIISKEISRYFHAIETKDVIPDDEWKFGYFGQHHILMMPKEVMDPRLDIDLMPECFELQVKTLFQHAWSEAEHDLGYKPGSQPLEPDQLRQLAYTSAQAWGADRMFNELFRNRSS